MDSRFWGHGCAPPHVRHGHAGSRATASVSSWFWANGSLPGRGLFPALSWAQGACSEAREPPQPPTAESPESGVPLGTGSRVFEFLATCSHSFLKRIDLGVLGFLQFCRSLAHSPEQRIQALIPGPSEPSEPSEPSSSGATRGSGRARAAGGSQARRAVNTRLAGFISSLFHYE